jgi:hypothetical protein
LSWAKTLTENKSSKRRLFPHVKNRSLLDLGALHIAFYYDSDREPARSITKRAYEKGLGRSSIAFELEPDDVISILGCSERKAKEYISMLRVLSQ